MSNQSRGLSSSGAIWIRFTLVSTMIGVIEATSGEDFVHYVHTDQATVRELKDRRSDILIGFDLAVAAVDHTHYNDARVPYGDSIIDNVQSGRLLRWCAGKRSISDWNDVKRLSSPPRAEVDETSRKRHEGNGWGYPGQYFVHRGSVRDPHQEVEPPNALSVAGGLAFPHSRPGGYDPRTAVSAPVVDSERDPATVSGSFRFFMSGSRHVRMAAARCSAVVPSPFSRATWYSYFGSPRSACCKHRPC